MAQTNLLKLTSVVTAVFILAAVFFLGYHQKINYPVLAKQFGGPLCDSIIPAANPLESSVELVDVVFQDYGHSADAVDLAIKDLSAILASLDKNNGQACDFSQCVPQAAFEGVAGQTKNVAPEFKLRIDLYLAEIEAGLRPPFCVATQCQGDPCGTKDIAGFKKELEAVKNQIANYYQDIRTTFSVATETVSEDTRVRAGDFAGRPEEIAGVTKVTKQEMVQREIDWANSALEKCSMTDLERKKAEAGKYGYRYVLECEQALAEGKYWPRPWSESCQKECDKGATKDCFDCLAKCEGTSFLSNINCKIYSSKQDEVRCYPNGKCCGEKCRQGVDDPDCLACLCEGLSETQCKERLCGGNIHNFVCCDENTGGNFEDYYVAMTDFNVDYESGGPKEKGAGLPASFFSQTNTKSWQGCLYCDFENNKFVCNQDQQVGEASYQIIDFLNYLAQKLPPGNFSANGFCQNWFITAISDHDGIATRNGHSGNSCHYGGPTEISGQVNLCAGKSHAVDIDVPGNNLSVVEQWALAYKQEFGQKVGGVCVYEEGDHLHVSVGGQTCGCDIKCSQASGVCHKTWIGTQSCD